MMPLVEDYLRSLLESRIRWLKNNPDQVTNIFGVLGKRSTLSAFKSFLVNTDIKVLLGYPREATQVPAYVVTLAGESEVVSGLGDSIDEDLNKETEAEYGDYSIDVSWMDTNYRIEAWSDNADLTVYMYIIAKWAMMVSRNEMLKSGFVLPRISGTDLEPAPDYLPQFIYRRTVVLSFQYENRFYETEEMLREWEDIVIEGHYYPYTQRAYAKEEPDINLTDWRNEDGT